MYNSPEKVRSHLRSGYLMRYRGREVDEQLVAAAEAGTDPMLAAQIYIYLCAVACVTAQFRRSEEFGTKAVTIIEDHPEEALGLREPGLDTLYNRLAINASCRRDVPAYRHYSIMQLLSLSDRSKTADLEVVSIAVALRNLADAELLQGRVSNAAAVHALAVWQPIAAPRGAAHHHEFYARLLLADGQIDRAIEEARRGADLAVNDRVYLTDTSHFRTLMWLQRENGDHTRALHTWSTIVEVLNDAPPSPLDLLARAELAVDMGDIDFCGELVAQAEPMLDTGYEVHGQHLSWLIKAKIAAYRLDFADAHRYLDRTEADNPDYLVALRVNQLRLEIYENQGDLNGILQQLERRIQWKEGTSGSRDSPEALGEMSDTTLLIQSHSQLLAALLGQYKSVVELVAHDIRSALALGQMAVVQLDDDPLNAARIIDRMVESVRSIIDLLSTAASVDRERLPVTNKETSLDTLITSTIDRLQMMAEAKRIELSVELGPVIGQRVDIDANLFSMSLANLIHNAIKYTPLGGMVDVAVSIDHGADRLDVAVSDSGPGLAEGEADRIFNRYVTGTASPTGNESRLGLGLHLSQRLVSLLGGRVHASSAGPGKGSTFTLSLYRFAERSVDAEDD